MAKRHQGKGRNRTPAPRMPAREGTNDAPGAKPEETLIPNPPRRNLPLLAASIVLLLVWLAILAWLAVTA